MAADRSLDEKRKELLQALLKSNVVSKMAGVVPVDRSRKISASEEQKRLWVQAKINPDTTHFHIPCVFEVTGKVDVMALQAAVDELVKLHEPLRTSLYEEDGAVYQHIADAALLPVTVQYAVAIRPPREAVDRWLQAQIKLPFDLGSAPLARALAVQTSESEWILCLVLHHAISDGWSNDLLLRQLSAIYSKVLHGEPHGFQPARLQYADYAHWQLRAMEDERFQSAIEYWRRKLHGVEPLAFETDRPRPAVLGNRGELFFFKMDADRVQAIDELSRRFGTTRFVLFMAAYQKLLADLTGQMNFCVGTTMANRGTPGTAEMMGFFANLMAVRSEVDGAKNFAELIRVLTQSMAEGFEHQALSFNKVVEHCEVTRDPARTPVFQTNLVLQNTKDVTMVSGLDLEGTSSRRVDHLYKVAQYELTLFIEEQQREFLCCFAYNTCLFLEDRIRIYSDNFLHQIEMMLERTETAFDTLPKLTPGIEKSWHTMMDGPKLELDGRNVVSAFRESVERHAGDGCIDDGVTSLTYGEVDALSNQLANYLIANGMEPSSTVGICLARNCNLLVAILAVLKAGSTYVPLDSSYPEEHLNYMIEDSGVRVILTTEDVLEAVEAFRTGYRNFICLDSHAGAISECSSELPEVDIPDGLPAYVMYTSGSTGLPKGVVISHRSILRLALLPSFVSIDRNDVVLAAAPTAFDASTFEFWVPLFRGAKIAMADAKSVSLHALGGFLERQQVTVAWLTAGLFKNFVDHFPDRLKTLRLLLTGGEVVSPSHVARAYQASPELTVINGYGPTEATTFACTYAVPRSHAPDRPVPIGRPITNTGVYVLDKDFRLAAFGAIGELYISGDGLSIGYLNKPELTAERFVPDPIRNDGSRMYRTGDLARWNSENFLEFLGREDRQIKIRGYRIEPAEVESHLQRYAGVRSAVVTARVTKEGAKQLAAYLLMKDGVDVDPEAIAKYLSRFLPEYMIPAVFISVDEIPLTTNGKVDYEALANARKPNTSARAKDTGESDTEAKLRRIWQEVLENEDIGREQSFFNVGGDSLLAIQVKVKSAEAGLDFEFEDLFRYSTIAELASHLDRAPSVKAAVNDTAGVVEYRNEYPLSRLQQGMYYDSERYARSSLYHDVLGYTVAYPFDREVAESALDFLVRRHELLRTRFAHGSSGLTQVVSERSSIPMMVFDISDRSENITDELIEHFMDDERFKPFDFFRGPLFRCFVFVLGSDSFKLIWSFHHVLLDGWSEATLTAEFLQFYIARRSGGYFSPPKIETRYQTYIELEQKSISSSEDREFWRTFLEGFEPTDLRVGDGVGSAADESVDYEGIVFTPQENERVLALARETNTSIKSVLLASHLLALRSLTGRNDLTVAVVTHVRPETGDSSNMVGLFLNSLPFRAKIDSRETFRELIQTVFATERNVFQHRYYPSQCIRDDHGGVPLYNILFNFTHFHVLNEVGHGVLEKISKRVGFAVNTFDIVFDFSVAAGSNDITLLISYRKDKFDERWVSQIADQHREALAALADTNARVSSHKSQVSGELLKWGQARTFPGLKGIIETFRAHAAERPDNVAVVEDDASCTYVELDHASTACARALRQKGVKAGSVVATYLERSTQLLVVNLAILKLGGVLLNLDPDQPTDRLNYIVKDAKVKVVVTTTRRAGKIDAPDSMCVEDVPPADDAPFDCGDPRATGYLIYTSGSTGAPKGVLNHESGIRGLFADLLARLPIDRDSRFLWKTPFTFDVSLTEMLMPLCCGARLVVAKHDGHYDPDYLIEQILRHQVTVLNFVPSMLSIFTEYLGEEPEFPVKVIVAAGEVLPEAVADKVRSKLPGTRLFNAYGPTEASIYATLWDCDEAAATGTILIGRSCGPIGVYILSSELEPVPVRMVGELYLSGDALAHGYFNLPELTAESFIPDPFSSEPGKRIYRTGDLARFTATGDIDYLDRRDRQVKLRGQRIELGEVESVIAGFPECRQVSVVLNRSSEDDQELVAFISTEVKSFDLSGLKDRLRAKLPGYMIPSRFVLLSSFPLTSSGKFDVQQLLRSIPAPASRVESDSAQDGLVGKIKVIWQEALGRRDIGLSDTFFEAGGNSLSMLRVYSRLRKEVDEKLKLNDLFEFPTISSLAAYLTGTEVERSPAPAARGAADTHKNDIAIIGMSAAFAGCHNVDEYWRKLLGGQDAITRHDREALRSLGVPEDIVDNAAFVSAKGILPGYKTFDPQFFGLTPREALFTDPQVRKLLEHSYLALENACYAGERQGQPVGVFVGTGTSNYLIRNVVPRIEQGESTELFSIGVMNQPATQIAYRLNLSGPAIMIHSACSTSLVAIHMACQSIRQGDCTMAIAGAASITDSRVPGYIHAEGGIYSRRGVCRPFDSSADGTVEGNGVGVVVLKALDAAIRDRDYIYAVIKGSAINNDGRDKVGYTAPGVVGQTEVIAAALRNAGVAPESVSYLEAHGTGTKLGDPIELRTLARNYARRADKRNIYLGSAKANIGHSDTAAGVAGVVKVALALKHKLIPPMANFEKPIVELQDSGFEINREVLPWNDGSPGGRTAGVSSFGIGGTNAHAILSEAPEIEPSQPGQEHYMYPVSARSAEALEANLSALSAFLDESADASPLDVAFSLLVGRPRLPFRAALVGERGEKAVRIAATRQPTGRTDDGPKPVVFAFTGQGSQSPGMGHALYATESSFHAAVDRCAELFKDHLGFDVRDLYFCTRDGSLDKAAETLYAQPALFTFEWALVSYWMGMGIKPELLIGHSLGELVAAAVAGVLSLEDATRVVSVRAKCMMEAPRGQMLAAVLDPEKAFDLASDELAIASWNSENQVVFSGSVEAVKEAQRKLQAGAIPSSVLKTSHAFHCPLMQTASKRMESQIRELRFQAPKIPIVSNRDGQFLSDETAIDPSYWSSLIVSPVRFHDGVKTIDGKGGAVWLEIGPREVLGSFIRRARLSRPHQTVLGAPSVVEPGDTRRDLCRILGELWVHGAVIEPAKLFEGERPRRASLPGYSFEKKEYWLESDQSQREVVRAPSEPEVFRPVVASPGQRSGDHADGGVLEQVAIIWKQCFGIEEISPTANFFHLGGDSLLAVELINKIKKTVVSELTIKELFANPTISGLTKLLEQKREARAGGPARKRDGVQGSSKGGDEKAELSFPQRRIYVLERMGLGGSVFHLPESTVLTGPLDALVFEDALRAMIERHPILRTRFVELGGDPYQEVAREIPFSLEVLDARVMPSHSKESFADDILAQLRERPFDLGTPPLFRAILIQLENDVHRFLLVFHHIIFDGWSFKVFLRDFKQIYEALLAGQKPALLPLPASYLDYSRATQALVSTERYERQKEFWMKYLDGHRSHVLPYDGQVQSPCSSEAQQVDFVIPQPLTAMIDEFARRNASTQYAVLLAGFSLALFQKTGATDFTVGSPYHNRRDSDYENMLGFFVNLVVTRVRFSATDKLKGFFAGVRDNVLLAQDNQDFPFEKAVELCEKSRSAGRNPLFQVLFSMQEPRSRNFSLGDLKVSFVRGEEGHSEYDLVLNLYRSDAGYDGFFQFKKHCFRRQSIELLAENFKMALEFLVSRPEAILTEVLQQAQEGNELARPNEARRWRCPETLSAMLARHWNSSSIALSHAGDSICYVELDRRSNRVRSMLRAEGAGRLERVAMVYPNSIDAIVILVAILREGGQFVMIDANSPPRRIEEIVREFEPSLVIQDRERDFFAQGRKQLVLKALDGSRCVDAPGEREVDPAFPAYTIFTSGTTGRPKGVTVCQRVLACKIAALVETYGIVAEDRVLQFASLSFDVALEEIFTTLAAGARLFIADRAQWRTMANFRTYIDENRITVVNLPASFFQEWIQELVAERLSLPESLRLVIAGSEVIFPESIALWKRLNRVDRPVELLNAYGTTETTITSLFHRISSEDSSAASVPIGKPLPYCSAMILDNELNPVTPGTKGEICIGGDALASHYRHMPELTAAAFVPDPYSGVPGSRLYRTGDIGFADDRGNICFLGRKDRQVKVRGHRVELDEIEKLLVDVEGVREAAVKAHGDPMQPQIVGYLAVEGALDARAVKASLARRAPQQLIPDDILLLDRLPRNVNDKIDYDKLSHSPLLTEPPRPVPPSSSGQLDLLLAICSEVLSRRVSDPSSNFFEVGGNSLSILKVIAGLEKRGMTIDPKLFLEGASLEEIARNIEVGPEPQRCAEPERTPPTPFQRKQLARRSPDHWHRSLLLELGAELRADVLKSAVEFLVQSKPELRLVWEWDSSQWRHAAAGAEVFTLHDFRDLSPSESEKAIMVSVEEHRRALRLDRYPLVRVAHYARKGAKNVLFILTHGLIADTYSWSLLLEELQEIYRRLAQGAEPRKPVSSRGFQAFSTRLEALVRSPESRKKVQAYLAILVDASALPVDHHGRPNLEASQRAETVFLDYRKYPQLDKAGKSTGGVEARFRILQSCGNVLCRRAGGKLLFDIGCHGRDLFTELNLSAAIGCFTLDFPAALEAHVGASLESAARALQERLSRTPLEVLSLDDTGMARPKSLVSFDYITEKAGKESELFRVSKIDPGPDRDPEDERSHLVNIVCLEEEDGVKLEFRYSVNLFEHSTILTLLHEIERELKGNDG